MEAAATPKMSALWNYFDWNAGAERTFPEIFALNIDSTSVFEIMTHPLTMSYFVALFFSIRYCFARAPGWSKLVSIMIIGITWFHIFRYAHFYYKAGGGSFFVDAYRDVSQPPHYQISSQLLTWVVVATILSRHADVRFTIYGMLGAMSGAYVLWFAQLFISMDEKVSTTATKPTRNNKNLAPVQDIVQDKIPLSYVVVSAVTLVSISSLPRVIQDAVVFERWLMLGHCVLILPRFGLIQGLFDVVHLGAFEVYSCLAVIIAAMHRLDPFLRLEDLRQAWPQSDCQISIGYDVLFCTLLSLYFIYKDSGLIVVAVEAVAVFFFSPGAVLAAHLAWICWPGYHRSLVTSMQASVASQMTGEKKPGFMNLGLWETKSLGNVSEDYAQACEALAMKVGKQILQKGDAVLCCGCGYGAELDLYLEEFDLKHITGVDLNPEAVAAFQRTPKKQMLCRRAETSPLMFHKGFFNKIIALDCAYHFDTKESFLSNCASHLSARGGKIALADIVIRDSCSSFWMSAILRLANVRKSNCWPREEYESKLARLGFSDIRMESISSRVAPRWFPEFIRKGVDYCIVSATIRPSKECIAPRKKIAVVGSGMAGLVAAKRLSEEFDVTIYEAQGKLSLSGHSFQAGGCMVDIPVRMILPRYYQHLSGLIEDLGIETTRTRTDTCFYGEDCCDSKKGSFNYEQTSGLRNLCSILPVVWEVLKISRCIATRSSQDHDETWSMWLERNGIQNTGILSRVMKGSLSWIFSCSYAQVENYPAEIILDYLRCCGLSISNLVFGSDSDQVCMRAAQGMRDVENALVYGSQIRLGTPVSAIDEDNLTIDGISYDKIIVATAAKDVSRIVPNADKVFGEVKYQASSIVVHKDPSLMPPNRKDWRGLNVRSTTRGEDMGEITLWGNRFFQEDLQLEDDLFGTWNPHKRPETVLREAHFYRVVHTSQTKNILSRLEKLQGQNGIFYAGAYSVYGAGLLEEAALSGTKAAELVKESS